MAKEITTATPAAPLEQEIQTNNTEQTVQTTQKIDKRRKDPSQPVVVPFQLVTATNRARLANIGKPNDETLSKLLDAFEGGIAGVDQQAQQTITRLQAEIKDFDLRLSKANKSVQINAAALQQRDNELKELQKQFAAKEQELSSKNTEITALKQELQDVKAELENAGNESDAEIENTIKELKDRASKAEDQAKQGQELINGLNEAKRELQNKLSETETKLATANEALLNIRRENNAVTGEVRDFLQYFPTITALMLERTAEKMTECRKDDVTVTPQMILADMFNRYTIERWNLWFYKWVLEDEDLIEIAQQVDNRITSIRMLKAALNIK